MCSLWLLKNYWLRNFIASLPAGILGGTLWWTTTNIANVNNTVHIIAILLFGALLYAAILERYVEPWRTKYQGQ